MAQGEVEEVSLGLILMSLYTVAVIPQLTKSQRFLAAE